MNEAIDVKIAETLVSIEKGIWTIVGLMIILVIFSMFAFFYYVVMKND